MSWLKSLWQLDLSAYFPDASFRVNAFLFWIAVGLCAAALIANFYYAALCGMLKKLLRAEAKEETSAKTLAELKLDGDLLLRMMLQNGGGRLSYYVARAGEKKMTYEEYIAAEREKKERRKAKKSAAIGGEGDGKSNAAIGGESDGKSNAAIGGAGDAVADAGSGMRSAEPERYYLKAGHYDEAVAFFEKDRSSPLHGLLSALLILAAGFLLMILMPSLLSFFALIFS